MSMAEAGKVAVNPYLIHPGENPSAVIVQPLLKGVENYHCWKRAVSMVLSMKGKLKFVDGSLPKPAETDRHFEIWCKCNDMVSNWLVNSLDPSISQSVFWLNTAREIWLDLDHRFGIGNAYRLSNLQEEIYSTKQGTLSVTQYFTKLKGLWDQLLILRPIHPYTCAALPIYREQNETDYVVRFLKGLNDVFSNVRSQALMAKPIPDIGTVFNMALQHESQNTYSELGIDKTVLNVVTTGARQNFQDSVSLATHSNVSYGRGGGRGYSDGYSGASKRPQCTYCGKKGHTIDKCYKKYGFPNGSKGRGRGQVHANNVSVDHGFTPDDASYQTSGQDNLDAQQSDLVQSNFNTMTRSQYEHIMDMLRHVQVADPPAPPTIALTANVQGSSSGSGQHLEEDDWFS